MAIHAKQGRRSGGSKKNSRRGYGNVAGAASSGAGSQQANAARHADQGGRSGGDKRTSPSAHKHPLTGDRGRATHTPNSLKKKTDDKQPTKFDLIGAKRGVEPPKATGGMFSVPPEKVTGKAAPKGLVPDTEGLPDVPSDAPKKGAAAAGGKKGASDLMGDLDANSKADLPKADVDAILQTPPEADAPADGGGGLDLPPVTTDGPAGRPTTEAPYMADVPVVTGADTKHDAPSSSGSTTWDHSALEEARAARAKLDQLRGSMQADAYNGDIGAYLDKGAAAAALARQAQAAEAQGSVISRRSFDSDMGGTSGGYDVGSAQVPTMPDSIPKAAPMPDPDPGMPLSTVKAGDPEPNHQAFIKKSGVPAIAKNVVNPNKYKNFA